MNAMGIPERLARLEAQVGAASGVNQAEHGTTRTLVAKVEEDLAEVRAEVRAVGVEVRALTTEVRDLRWKVAILGAALSAAGSFGGQLAQLVLGI